MASQVRKSLLQSQSVFFARTLPCNTILDPSLSMSHMSQLLHRYCPPSSFSSYDIYHQDICHRSWHFHMCSCYTVAIITLSPYTQPPPPHHHHHHSLHRAGHHMWTDALLSNDHPHQKEKLSLAFLPWPVTTPYVSWALSKELSYHC